jgi:rare lipoprotein A
MRRPQTVFTSAYLLLAALLFGSSVAPLAADEPLTTQNGKASWYGEAFDGKPTASGETFHSDYPLAAHPEWPFGTQVRVTNTDNERTLVVRVVDRGPADALREKGVIIDLSLGSAKVLGFVDDGVTDVRLEVLEWGENDD